MCVCVCTGRGGEQGRGPWGREVGRGSSSIGAKSQCRSDRVGRGVKATAADTGYHAAHAAAAAADAGHVGQVTDAVAATVAAAVGGVEHRGRGLLLLLLRRRVRRA